MVKISTTEQTHNIPLAVYDIRSRNKYSTLRSLVVCISALTPNLNIGDGDINKVFSSVRLRVGSQTYYSPTVVSSASKENAASWVLKFENLTIPLPANVYVPMTLSVDVNQDTNNVLDGMQVSTELTTQSFLDETGINIDVEDDNNANLPVEPADLTSSILTFSGADAFLSNKFATIGSAIIGAVDGVPVVVGYNVSFGFTVTAVDQVVYVSSDPKKFVEWGVSPGTADDLSLPIGGVVPFPGSLAGDTDTMSTNGYYVIPPGSSRQFTFNGSLMRNGMSGLKTAWFVGIFYGTSPTNIGPLEIGYGLQNLRVATTF